MWILKGLKLFNGLAQLVILMTTDTAAVLTNYCDDIMHFIKHGQKNTGVDLIYTKYFHICNQFHLF